MILTTFNVIVSNKKKKNFFSCFTAFIMKWCIMQQVQSAAELFKYLRWCLRFFSVLIAKFYHITLVINNVKPKNHDLTYNYLFNNLALNANFLMRNIPNGRINLLSTVSSGYDGWNRCKNFKSRIFYKPEMRLLINDPLLVDSARKLE